LETDDCLRVDFGAKHNQESGGQDKDNHENVGGVSGGGPKRLGGGNSTVTIALSVDG